MFEINYYKTDRTINNSQSIEKYSSQNKELSQVAFQLVNDAIIITDVSGCIQFLNPVAEKLTGCSLPDVYSLSIWEICKFIHKTTFEPRENFLEKVLREHQCILATDDSLLVRLDGSRLSFQYSAAPFYDQKQQVIGAVLVFWELSNLAQLSDQKSLQNSHDSLTGLINRYSFEQFLEQAISSSKTLDRSHVLCYLDLDHFKIINESCGHEAGNEFLRQVSVLLQKQVRKSDLLARLGADEFGLLLYQCDLEPALKVIHTLCEEVKNFQFVWEEETFSFSISVGVVALKDSSENSSGVLNLASSACETAKSKGRNRVQIYQPNDIELVNHKGEIRWLSRIFKALDDNQFILYHQPIVPLNPSQQTGKSHRQKSCEILLRLQDEDGKIVPPVAFIPPAEKHGLMHLIDRWVIHNLFAYLKCNLSEQSLLFQGSYSVNLSGASLNDDRFLDFVKAQFTLYSIPPQIICFEITETLAIANLNQARLFMQELKALGCYFALDDFGSGMSSFGYLKSLPIDYLKIDGIFIKDIIHNQVGCEIVEAINRIAHTMGIRTVAEYVENNEIFLELKKMGIDYAQGYAIAKPSCLTLF